MTDVLSYRTERLEELKKLAKEKNISLSQLSSEIINEYLNFFLLTSKYDMFCESKRLISACFELLDESDLEKTSDILGNEVFQYLKTLTTDFSLPKIIEIVRTWYTYNHFTLDEFDEGDFIKLVTKNTMSKNWNLHNAKGAIKFFKRFGYDGAIDAAEEGLVSYKISKTKSSH